MSATASTTGSLAPPQVRFHRNLLEFIELVREIVTRAQAAKLQCSVSPFMIDIAKGVVQGVDPDVSIDKFIGKSHSAWEQIKNKDLEFFRNNAFSLFDALPEQQVKEFSALFDMKVGDQPLVDEETLERMWCFFHSSVKQSISYVHFKRDPDPETRKYRQTYMPAISIKKSVEMWEIKEFR
jgi:hypothetical protein